MTLQKKKLWMTIHSFHYPLILYLPSPLILLPILIQSLRPWNYERKKSQNGNCTNRSKSAAFGSYPCVYPTMSCSFSSPLTPWPPPPQRPPPPTVECLPFFAWTSPSVLVTRSSITHLQVRNTGIDDAGVSPTWSALCSWCVGSRFPFPWSTFASWEKW